MMDAAAGRSGGGAPGGWRRAAGLGLVALLGWAGCGPSNTEITSDGAECRTDDDCMEGAFCHASGVCVEECRTDVNCAVGEVCIEGRCVATGSLECEYPCPAQMQCVLGECLWDCEMTADCPGGFECVDGHCQVGECSGNEDCAEGLVCLEARCVDASCGENADCDADSICSGGECTFIGECTEDRHCGHGQTCLDGVCEGQVVPTTSVPVPCETNRDCSERYYCIDGVCRHSIECLVHAHCPAGEACFERSCVVP